MVDVMTWHGNYFQDTINGWHEPGQTTRATATCLDSGQMRIMWHIIGQSQNGSHLRSSVEVREWDINGALVWGASDGHQTEIAGGYPYVQAASRQIILSNLVPGRNYFARILMDHAGGGTTAHNVWGQSLIMCPQPLNWNSQMISLQATQDENTINNSGGWQRDSNQHHIDFTTGASGRALITYISQNHANNAGANNRTGFEIVDRSNGQVVQGMLESVNVGYNAFARWYQGERSFLLSGKANWPYAAYSGKFCSGGGGQNEIIYFRRFIVEQNRP